MNIIWEGHERAYQLPEHLDGHFALDKDGQVVVLIWDGARIVSSRGNILNPNRPITTVYDRELHTVLSIVEEFTA